MELAEQRAVRTTFQLTARNHSTLSTWGPPSGGPIRLKPDPTACAVLALLECARRIRPMSTTFTTFTTVARAVRLVLAALVIVTVSSTAGRAQWEPYPWKNVPRTAYGKVDLKATARRTSDGKIELSGFWMPTQAVKHLLNLAADLKPEEVPLQPWAEAVYKERIDTNGKDHPGARCWPSGIPEKLNIPDGLKVVQTPDLMLFLHESRTIYRQIFTDGRPLPKDAQPTWMGYS